MEQGYLSPQTLIWGDSNALAPLMLCKTVGLSVASLFPLSKFLLLIYYRLGNQVSNLVRIVGKITIKSFWDDGGIPSARNLFSYLDTGRSCVM